MKRRWCNIDITTLILLSRRLRQYSEDGKDLNAYQTLEEYYRNHLSTCNCTNFEYYRHHNGEYCVSTRDQADFCLIKNDQDEYYLFHTNERNWDRISSHLKGKQYEKKM